MLRLLSKITYCSIRKLSFSTSLSRLLIEQLALVEREVRLGHRHRGQHVRRRLQEADDEVATHFSPESGKVSPSEMVPKRKH